MILKQHTNPSHQLMPLTYRIPNIVLLDYVSYQLEHVLVVNGVALSDDESE